MDKLLKIGKNVVTNFQLSFWFFTSLFLTYCSTMIVEQDLPKFILGFLASIIAGVFVNLYTEMFGTNKTTQVLNALYAVLNDYYYLAGQRDLTQDEQTTMRRLVAIVKTLDTDDTRIELFRKYKKEQVFNKTSHLQTTGQTTTFNSSQLNFADMTLNSWGDPQNTMASGSANSMVDPTYNLSDPNRFGGTGSNPPTFGQE
jgi:uncharacterized membrane protein